MELVIENGLVHLFLLNASYSCMKSVAVKNKFHRRVKYTHNKGCVYENNVQKNLGNYFPLNHGCPYCVTVTIVTALYRMKTYLICDGHNIFSCIHPGGSRCGTAG